MVVDENKAAVIGAIEVGSVTNPSQAGGNTLVDANKNWATGVYRNRLVRIVLGAGAGQAAWISGNSNNTLVLSSRWVEAIDTTSVYVILDLDIAQVMRDVFGGGSDISAANPLETHDPKLEAVEDKLDDPDHGLAALKAAISSVAGGAFYGSYGPRNVEVDNDVDFGQIVYDPSGNIITTGEITPGTCTVRRVRADVDTQIVAPTASSEAAGRVYTTYSFPVASWNVGDIFYIIFSGITVTLDGVTTEYPDLYIWGRVVREADISTKIDEKPEWGAPTTGTHTTSSGAEETIVETNLAAPFLFYMLIDLMNMVAGDCFTFRVYQKVDGTNYRLKDSQQFIDAQTIDVYQIEGLYGDADCDIKVTVTRSSGTNRSFPYRYNTWKEA